MTLRLALATAAAMLALAAPAAAAPDTILHFQDLPLGTQVHAQYPGVTIGTPSSFKPTSSPGYFCSLPGTIANPAVAFSGQALTTGACAAGESGEPVGGVLLTFSTFRSHLSLYQGRVDPRDGVCFIGQAPACNNAKLIGYDINGNKVAESDGYATYGWTQLSISTPSLEIAYAVLAGDYTHTADYFDDVQFDNPDVPPAPQVKLAQAGVLRAPVGQQSSVDLPLDRFNGSTGPVSMSVSGLPAGVTSHSFSPNPTSGTLSTLNLTLAADATPGDYPVTITATPTSSSAGTTPSTTTLTLQVRAPYSLDTPRRFTLRPCEANPLQVHLAADSGFTQPVTITADATAGATITPSSVTITPGFEDTVTFTVSAGQDPPSGSITLAAQAAGYARVLDLLPLDSAPGSAAASLGPGEADTFGNPRLTWDGDPSPSSVHLTGSGWCPGSTVSFGNDFTRVPLGPIGRDSSGRLTSDVTLPISATSGPVTVHSGGHDIPAGNLTIDSFRSVFGFRFGNPSEKFQLTTDDIHAVFGQARTDINVDVCSGLTLGVASCNVSALRPSVSAWRDQLNDSINAAGLCFGTSEMVLRLLRGKEKAVDYGAGPAGSYGLYTAYQIPTDANGGPRPDMHDAIHFWHATQFTDQVQTARNRHPGSTAELAASVRTLLSALRPPLIGIHSGGKGHALAVYASTYANGNLTLSLYDPNYPFASGETGTGGGFNRESREGKGTLTFDKDGHWVFYGFPTLWSGTLSDIYILPYDSVPGPGQGTLPEPLNSWVTYVPLGASVADSSGRSVDVAPLEMDEPTLRSGVLPGGGTYTVTGASGPVTMLGRGFEAAITPDGGARAAASARAITLAPGRRMVTTGGGTVTLISGSGRDERTLTVSSRQPAQVQFSSGSAAKVSSAGPVSVTLVSVGSHTGSVSLGRVGAQGGLTISPNWSALGRSAVTVRHGRVVRRMRGRSAGAGRLSLGAPSIHAGRVSVSVGLVPGRQGASGALAAFVKRGRKAIRVGSAVFDSGRHTLTMKLPNLGAGRHRLTLIAAAVGPAGVSRASRSVTVK